MQFGIGTLVGIGGGWVLWVSGGTIAGRWPLPILVLSGGVALFAFSNMLGGSGILSIYLGLFIGNRSNSQLSTLYHNVLDGMTWLKPDRDVLGAGAVVTPSTLMDIALPALALAFGMILFARRCLFGWVYCRSEALPPKNVGLFLLG